MALTALYDVLKAKLSDADKLALIKEFDEVLSLGLLKAAKALREEQNAQKSAVPEGMTAEEAAEIDPAWFEGAESVGICGATSTPKWLMQEVADRIGKIGKGK